MSTPRTVLVVEDDQDIRDTINELLELNGYQVLVAEHGQEALAVLRTATELPAVILLDLTMPVMDGVGFRTAQLADARLADIPVVVMTADGRIDEKCASLACTHALRKPMDVTTLLAAVARYF